MTISLRRAMAGIGVATLVVGLSACSSGSGGGGGGAHSSYTFGVLNSLTGDLGAVGQQERNGIELAVQEINAKGGAAGHKIKLTYFDDQGSVNQTTLGFKKLATSDNVPVILGPGITASAKAIRPLADQYGVTNILFVAQPEIPNGSKNVFEIPPPEDINSKAMVQYAAKGGAKTAALIYASNPYGQQGRTGVTNAAKSAGVTIKSSESWDPSAFDFTAQASKVASLKPDVVFLYGAGGTSDALLLKAVRSAGYQGKVVGDLSYSTNTIPKAAGAAANTVVGFSPVNFATPDAATKTFISSYQAKYKANPTVLAAYAYVGVNLAVQAIEKAGSTDGSKIASTIQDLNYKSLVGTLAYTKDWHGGPQSPTAFKPISFKNGKYTAPVF